MINLHYLMQEIKGNSLLHAYFLSDSIKGLQMEIYTSPVSLDCASIACPLLHDHLHQHRVLHVELSLALQLYHGLQLS